MRTAIQKLADCCKTRKCIYSLLFTISWSVSYLSLAISKVFCQWGIHESNLLGTRSGSSEGTS